MFGDRKAPWILFPLGGLLLSLAVLGLAVVNRALSGQVSPESAMAVFLNGLNRHDALIWNLLLLTCLALVLEYTVGFQRGFLQQFREYWRRVPRVVVFLILTIGLLALAVNLDRVALVFMQTFSSDELARAYELQVTNRIRGAMGIGATAFNTMFLVMFSAAMITGFLRTPEWHLRRPTPMADLSYSGSVSIVTDPRKRKRLRKAERLLERRSPVRAAELLEGLGEEYCYRAGKLFLDRGLEKKAATAFERAAQYYTRKGNFLRAGDAWFFGGFWQKSADAYQQFEVPALFKEDRERVRIWLSRWGEALFHLKKFHEAAKLFEEYSLFKKAGEAYEKAGMATKAAQAYARGGAHDSSFKALQSIGEDQQAQVQKAKHLAQQGEHTRAAALFEQVGEFHLAADAYVKSNFPRKAALCFQQAGKDRDAVEWFLQAGEEEEALKCYQAMGEFEKAAQLAAHLGLQDKQAFFYEKSARWTDAARAYLMIGETQKAGRCLAKVKLDQLRVVEECEQILAILMERERLQEARYCAECLLNGKPRSRLMAPLLLTQARVYELLSGLQKAATLAIEAAKLAPDNRMFGAQARLMAEAAGVPLEVFEKPARTGKTSGSVPTVKTEARPSKPAPAQPAPEPNKPAEDDGNVDITQTLDDNSVYDLTQDGPLKRYQILQELGRGGMGRVYKARDRRLNRLVALKMLHPELNHEPKILLFFKREVHAIAALNHPNIVSLYDAGMEKGSFYMIMEYVKGLTLEKLLQRHHDAAQRGLIWIWYQACLGLQFAHEQGILHRDLKPTNIMVTRTRGVKILDFGLAKQVTDASKTKQVWGTPAFMAPELFYGQRAGFQSDIYGLGATFYLLATGRPPYYGDDPAKKFVGDGLPVTPEELNGKLNKMVSRTILKCLYLQPQDRYKDCGELIRDLKRCGRH